MIERYLPDFLPFEAINHLQKAIIKNPLPEDPTIWDVLNDCRQDDGEIYVISDHNSLITGAFYIEFYPQLMNVALLGGDNIKAWGPELVNFLRTTAKERGITHLSIIGRHGWSRIFKDLKPVGTFYIAE